MISEQDSKLFGSLLSSLPPFIARQDVKKYLGGIIAPKTLANLDSKGEGPAGVIKAGRKVVYTTLPLLIWLENRFMCFSKAAVACVVEVRHG